MGIEAFKASVKNLEGRENLKNLDVGGKVLKC
jgi:hypothetical protein